MIEKSNNEQNDVTETETIQTNQEKKNNNQLEGL